jgi:hypothetical protein
MCVGRCSRLCEGQALSSKCVASFHWHKTHTHWNGIIGGGWISFSYVCKIGGRGGNPSVDDIPISKCDNKTMHHVPPKKDHDSKRLSGKNLTTIILWVKDVPHLGLLN